ncbi:MAG TPA: hypothetical protein VF041_02530 [Gemmatimonadaceae bacterium]
MNAETRRRLAALLAGIAGAYVALSVASWLRQDACLDAGGRWLAAARACELPGGAPPLPPPLRAYIVGAVVGIVVAVVLWRTFTFFARRGATRRANR